MNCTIALAAMTDCREQDHARTDPSPVPALLRRIRKGDEAAFREIYDQMALPLYGRMLALTGGEELSSREVVQDTMLKLLKSPPDCADDRHLAAWLTRVARNIWIDRVRREKRHDHLPLEENDRPDEMQASLVRALRDSLENIPSNDAELLRLAYVDRIPLDRIAEDRGITYKALEGRLARLKNSLRNILLTQLHHENQP